MKFAFKELDVWQTAVQFTVEVIDMADNLSTDRKHFRLLEPIEASSASIAMNIAEGKERFYNKESVH